MTQCFMLDPLPAVRFWKRRYWGENCPSGQRVYHQAMELVGDFSFFNLRQGWLALVNAYHPQPLCVHMQNSLRYTPESIEKIIDFLAQLSCCDPYISQFPRKCECGDEYKGHFFQAFERRLYQKRGTEDVYTLHDAPPGAMYYASWYLDQDGKCRLWWDNQDSPPLIVRCPDGHDWVVDSRAKNCTLPADKTHRCWIRHGEPPLITVDKAGETCSAGAGSIMSPGGYHGFLREGKFKP